MTVAVYRFELFFTHSYLQCFPCRASAPRTPTNVFSPYQPGAVTENGRDKFIKDTLATQRGGPGPTFTTLNIWHNCDATTFRWRLNVQPIAITGIDVLVIKPGTHLIQTDYSESNNIVFLTNIGCQITGGPCGLNCARSWRS